MSDGAPKRSLDIADCVQLINPLSLSALFGVYLQRTQRSSVSMPYTAQSVWPFPSIRMTERVKDSISQTLVSYAQLAVVCLYRLHKRQVMVNEEEVTSCQKDPPTQHGRTTHPSTLCAADIVTLHVHAPQRWT